MNKAILFLILFIVMMFVAYAQTPGITTIANRDDGTSAFINITITTDNPNVDTMFFETNATLNNNLTNVTIGGKNTVVLMPFINGTNGNQDLFFWNMAMNQSNGSCTSGGCPTGNVTHTPLFRNNGLVYGFDDTGTQDEIVVTGSSENILGTNELQIEIWANETSQTSSNALVGRGINNAGESVFFCGGGAGSEKDLRAQVDGGAELIATNTCIQGQIAYYALSCNGLNCYLFKNGTQVAIQSNIIPNKLTSTLDIRMGSRDGPSYFSGLLGFPKVYRKAYPNQLNLSKQLYFGYNSNTKSYFVNHTNVTRNADVWRVCYNDTTGAYNCTLWQTFGAAGDNYPAFITLINLTSEGTQAIVNITDPFCKNTGCTVKNTTDTTPTFFIKTNETASCAIINLNRNLNYTDITKGISECATTGGLTHTCTLADENITTVGLRNFSVGCRDSAGNENSTGTSFFTINISSFIIIQADVNIFLNGSNETRKYEFNTTLLNKTYGVNISLTAVPNDTICLNFDYFVNWTCVPGNTSILMNLSELNNTRFSNGSLSTINITPSKSNISVKIDNNTDLRRIAFKLKGNPISSLFPTNISIDVNNDDRPDIIIPGIIRNNEIEINEFTTSQGPNRRAQNFTFVSSSSATININATSIVDVKNFTMQISALSLDLENEFSEDNRFKFTERPMNETLSVQTDSPMGVFDGFDINTSKWSVTTQSGSCILQYVNPITYLDLLASPGECYADYSDLAGDMRNSSAINVLFRVGGGLGSVTGKIYASDGTSNVELYEINGAPIDPLRSVNVTITRLSEDDKTWNVAKNDSAGTSGTRDLSSLDFTKQIKIRFFTSASTSPSSGMHIYLHEIGWSGIWLNYSSNNGTYKPTGNFTSRVVNVTKTNVSIATLKPSYYDNGSTDIKYYLSNTCNATTPTFEQVTPNVAHIFETTGNSICYRTVLNSSSNITSPIVRRVRVEVVKGSTNNISCDFGADGDADWIFPDILNSTTSPRIVNGSIADFATYKTNNCQNTLTCQYPVLCSINGTGIVSIDFLNMTQFIINVGNNTGEFRLSNLTKLETSTLWNWTFSFLNGLLNVYDLDVEFLGSKNFSLRAYSVSNASNDANITLQVLYSKFNITYPRGVSNFVLMPNSNNETNISIFGQILRQCNTTVDDFCAHTSTPIFNLSNLAYDENIDLYTKMNDSYNLTFFNFSLDLGVNRTTAMQINDSYQRLATNTSRVLLKANNSRRIFGFVDFYNVNFSNISSLDIDFEWLAYCNGCVR